jgi:hypothetical protein
MTAAMKTILTIITVMGLVVITKTPTSFGISGRINNGKGFAVLELFTSEGCSSCPPADALLAKIQNESLGKNVYLLAYHVDYWDRLGWKDAFSDPEFSNRQMQYGQWLGLSQVYTPQLIVNGKSQFVGSDESAINKVIYEQIVKDPVAVLTLGTDQENGVIKVKYRVTPMVKGSCILIALIQKTAKTKVLRGENAGLQLSHIQIVRKLQAQLLPASGEGNMNVSLPKDFREPEWELIGLVQNQSNGNILAVAKE